MPPESIFLLPEGWSFICIHHNETVSYEFCENRLEPLITSSMCGTVDSLRLCICAGIMAALFKSSLILHSIVHCSLILDFRLIPNCWRRIWRHGVQSSEFCPQNNYRCLFFSMYASVSASDDESTDDLWLLHIGWIKIILSYLILWFRCLTELDK